MTNEEKQIEVLARKLVEAINWQVDLSIDDRMHKVAKIVLQSGGITVKVLLTNKERLRRIIDRAIVYSPEELAHYLNIEGVKAPEEEDEQRTRD